MTTGTPIVAIPEEQVIDSVLSDSSENAVQNKVIKAELDKKVDIEDTYITDTDTSKNYARTLSVAGNHLVEAYTEVTTT